MNLVTRGDRTRSTSAAALRQKGRRHCRRCVTRDCAPWTRVWKGWLVFNCAWSANFKVKYSLPRWSGGMSRAPVKFILRVGFRHPEMMCNILYNATSSFLVWVLWHQAGVAYSAALWTKASEEVRRTEALAAHVEPGRRRKGQLRALTLIKRPSKCCLKVTWRSSVPAM